MSINTNATIHTLTAFLFVRWLSSTISGPGRTIGPRDAGVYKRKEHCVAFTLFCFRFNFKNVLYPSVRVFCIFR